MSYDFHIERFPDGGWDAWYEKMTPPELAQELADAKQSKDFERVKTVQSRIEATRDSIKQKDGLIISPQEWRKAVEEIPRLRLATSDTLIVNPKTGDTITIKVEPDDVAFLDDDGQWRNAISFDQSSATFRSRFWQPGNALATAVCELAERLGAKIVGDEGEQYPLIPGAQHLK